MYFFQRVYCIGLIAAVLGLSGCSLLENPQPKDKPIVLTYEQYDYIPASKKAILLNEEFDNNTRGWRTVNNSTQYSLNITGGELVLTTRTNEKQQNLIQLPTLKDSMNFEIETQVRVVNIGSSDDGSGNMLLWGFSPAAGAKPRQWLNYALYDDYKIVNIGSFNGQNADYFVNDETTQEAYRYRNYNKLTVRKVNKTCYYFLNGQFIATKPFTSFYGTYLGFGV